MSTRLPGASSSLRRETHRSGDERGDGAESPPRRGRCARALVFGPARTLQVLHPASAVLPPTRVVDVQRAHLPSPPTPSLSGAAPHARNARSASGFSAVVDIRLGEDRNGSDECVPLRPFRGGSRDGEDAYADRALAPGCRVDSQSPKKGAPGHDLDETKAATLSDGRKSLKVGCGDRI